MLWRLLVGFVIGLVVGGLMAAALVAGLKITAFAGTGGVALAYGAAALVGVLTGLFAGKPFWATDAKLEAGLKAFFGALLAAGGMFALRQWGGGLAVNLNGLGAGDLGRGALGELPATSLPLIAAVLGSLFELDNTGSDKPEGASKTRAPVPEPRRRVQAAGANGKGRAKASAAEVEDAASDEARRARR